MPQTESLVADLIEVLGQEQARLDALRHLLLHEQEAVRRWSATDLSAVTASKIDILDDLRALEARRGVLMTELGAQWNQPPDQLTLKDIAARVDPAHRRRLLDQREAMRTDVQDALVVQDVTQAILSQAMALCDDIMRLARQPAQPTPTYTETGLVTTGGETRAWVNRKG
jgi:flagellar biosynthesis/type III secretory pathway chaperone